MVITQKASISERQGSTKILIWSCPNFWYMIIFFISFTMRSSVFAASFRSQLSPGCANRCLSSKSSVKFPRNEFLCNISVSSSRSFTAFAGPSLFSYIPIQATQRQRITQHELPGTNALDLSVRWISGTKAARKKLAKKRLEMIRQGRDPKEEKRKRNEAIFGITTVEDVTHMYAQEKTEAKDGTHRISLRKMTPEDISKKEAEEIALKEEKRRSEKEQKQKKYSRKFRGKKGKGAKAALMRVDRVLSNRGFGSRSEMQAFCKSRRISIFTLPKKDNSLEDSETQKRHAALYERVSRRQPWFTDQWIEIDNDNFDMAVSMPEKDFGLGPLELPPFEIITGPSERIREDAVLCLDGTHVIPPLPVAFIYHKPTGVMSSMAAEGGDRPYLAQKLPKQLAAAESVHPVGRLDYDTSGLLLFSTRGDLTQRLLHPKHNVTKEYVAIVEGAVDRSKLRQQLEDEGVATSEGTHKAKLLHAEVLNVEETAEESRKGELKEEGNMRSCVRLVVSEGKHRMIRRMLANCGHPVLQLKRERYGDFLLGDLPVGHFRCLSNAEIDWLESLV